MTDVEGMTCVVTGATSGIGRATAQGLAHMGARVVIVARSRERGRQALMEICRDTGQTEVDLLLADLSDQSEVRRLAIQLAGSYPQLDVLVNNAGAIFGERRTSVDGIEMTLAVNHLAGFLLTVHLLETLRNSAPSRIVNVASVAHRRARLDLDDLQLEKRYSPWRAYRNSKLCNLLFTFELARRLEGTGVTVNAVHPGTVATGFGTNNSGFLGRMMALGRPFLKSARQGARTVLHVATSPEVDGISGGYWVDDRLRTPSAASRDEETASRLWSLSEALTGL